MDETEELRVNYSEETTEALKSERTAVINRHRGVAPTDGYDAMVIAVIDDILEERAAERGI